jgi:predicted  nucleic acid-binding Zn-ribbon protein
MCKANEYINKIKSVVSNINNEIALLNKELNKIERVHSDIEHKIENTNFNAAEGYALAYSLKITRNKRRDIKNEIYRLESIKDLSDTISKTESKLARAISEQDNWKYCTKAVSL